MTITKTSVGLVALMAGAAAAPAFAGGYVEPIAEPAPVVQTAPVLRFADWSGPYVGVFTGWAQDDVDSGFSGDPSPDGALLGLNAGYNWQSGPWVYGVEGDVAWTDLSERGDNGLKSDVKNTATLRGKIGYSTGRWLPYATVGYTVADVDYSVPGASDSETVDGYTVGIGTEYAVNQNWSLKGEYQYSDLQGDIDHKIDQVRLGVNYNF